MVRTVTSTTLSIQTDLTESPPANSSGILHGSNGKHVFCWIADSSHLNVAVNHLVKQKYDRDGLIFIPYSSKDNWIKTYTYATPSLECTENGQINHLIQHSLTSEQLSKLISSGNSNDYQLQKKIETKKEIEYPQLTQRNKKRKIGIELLTNSILTNAERDVLHIEIFKYFSWLKTTLEEVELVHAGTRTLLNTCAASAKVGECAELVMNVFKVVGDNNADEKLGEIPLLEKVLGDELDKLVPKAVLREFDTYLF
jgi:hypothetical protein